MYTPVAYCQEVPPPSRPGGGGFQHVVRLQGQSLQAATDAVHLFRPCAAAFDDRRHECGEARFFPALLFGQFNVNEIQAVEGMGLVLDAAKHVDTAVLARVALDGRSRIDNRQLVGVRRDRNGIAGNDTDHGEDGAFRLPALGATTGVVVGHIACDGDLNRLVRAQALQRAALEAGGSGNDAGIDRGMDSLVLHGLKLLLLEVQHRLPGAAVHQ